MNNTEKLSELLVFDFSRQEIIVMSLIPAVINLVIFIYVLFALPKNRTNYSFAILTFMVSMWQFADAFMRLSIMQSTAEDWYFIMGIFALFVTPFGVLFVLHFTKWNRKIHNGIIFFTQFFPAIVFLILNTARADTHAIIPSSQWHWIANPNLHTVTSIIYGWVSFQGIVILVLVWYAYVHENKDSLRKRQYALLAIGFTIPVVGGIVSQAVVPLIFRMDNLPITPALFTFFSIFTLIGMLRFQLLEYSPKHNWEQIVEMMNEGILIVNLNHEIMYANKMFNKTLGFKPGELNGTSAKTRFLKPDESISYDNSYEMLIQSGKGEKIWFLVCETPYIDSKGKTIGYIAIYTNINDSKRSEARFRALVENAGDIISMTNEKSEFTYVSPAMEKVIGYSLNDLKGRSIFEIMHPEQVQEAQDIFRNILDQPGALIPRTNRFIHKDGKEIWVEGVIINLLNDENVQGIVSNHRDISDRKANEMMIQQFLDVTTNQNQRLQNFAHIVSHNIRSHVVNITGLTEILTQTEFEHERENLMKMLKNSTSKLSETTDNLSNIITIQNNIDNQYQSVVLKDEISKTFFSINSISNINEMQLINDVDENLKINVIPSYLESILLNLTTNAIKYRSNDKPLKIHYYCEHEEDYIILCVRDNGLGIDMDTHGKKIFGMYKTFHNNKDSRGLGLFITKSQIEAMNGKIMVESEPGNGATFKVFFNSES